MNKETAHPEQGWAVCRKWEALTVKGGVGKIDILLIQPLLSQGNGLAEALEMNNFPFPQETDDVAHVWIIGQAKDIIVGEAGFLLWCNHESATWG